jgi:hypothetical protein
VPRCAFTTTPATTSERSDTGLSRRYPRLARSHYPCPGAPKNLLQFVGAIGSEMPTDGRRRRPISAQRPRAVHSATTAGRARGRPRGGGKSVRRGRPALAPVRKRSRARVCAVGPGPLPRRARPADAAGPLREARDLFESMGYRPALAETEALLAEAPAVAR